MKKFTSIQDVEDVNQLLQFAKKVKQNPFDFKSFGANKTLGLLFFNPSLRTRLSTQKAAMNLGMNVMVMNLDKEGWQIEFQDGTIMDQGSQEHIKEAAAVISQYCDIIGIRTFPSLQNQTEDYEEHILQQFIKNARVPIVSLESATRHPLQGFSDLMTIEEHKKVARPKVVLTWAPHPKALPQAVANSFTNWIKATDCQLVITNPKGFNLSKKITEGLTIQHNQKAALEGADFVYAKNWSSFSDYGKIGLEHQNWIVDAEKMKITNQAKFMHCLPVRRNVVVTDEVLNSKNALVIEQANNRTFAAQSVLLKLLENK